jgi:hypothetical protein
MENQMAMTELLTAAGTGTVLAAMWGSILIPLPGETQSRLDELTNQALHPAITHCIEHRLHQAGTNPTDYALGITPPNPILDKQLEECVTGSDTPLGEALRRMTTAPTLP